MKNFLLLNLLLILMTPKTAECQIIRDSVLYSKAKLLSENIFLIDTHIDLPEWVFDDEYNISNPTGRAQMEYPLAMEGGLNAAFFAVYTPPSLEGTERAKPRADTIIGRIHRVAEKYPDHFRLAFSSSDVLKIKDNKVIMIAIGMENGSPIDSSMDNLKDFYDKGVRYITLCHYKWNHICDSANDPERMWNGLSPFGEEVVKEMNKLGIMIDVSHVSDSTFYDVIRLSKAPIIASHSSSRFFTPGNERNMSDEMIRMLAEKGGVIQLNFWDMLLSAEVARQKEAQEFEIRKYLQENNIDPASQNGREYTRKFRKDNPVKQAEVSDLVDHIDHVVKLVGVDYVGLGSDFEGVGDNSLPSGLENVSKYPNIIYELLKRGYSEEDIKKIAGGNLLRVWKRVEEISSN
jgi:membrane dipeptidase